MYPGQNALGKERKGRIMMLCQNPTNPTKEYKVTICHSLEISFTNAANYNLQPLRPSLCFKIFTMVSAIVTILALLTAALASPVNVDDSKIATVTAPDVAATGYTGYSGYSGYTGYTGFSGYTATIQDQSVETAQAKYRFTPGGNIV